MAKNDFISGSVLEFKVPLDLGFAYCKVLDFRLIREFDGVLAKVFDHIVKEPIKDINSLIGKELLFGARRMGWLPNTRGKGAWKFKGVLIAEEDNIIPDFKYSFKSTPFMDEESTIKDWYVIKNIKESDDNIYSYNNVRHLENTVITSQYGIELRTAMEYCRKNNIDVTKQFDLSDEFIMAIYRIMVNVPIYSGIPKEIRGKAIC